MTAALADNIETLYFEERGKPMPGRNHSVVQSNIIAALAGQPDFRVMCELNLDLDGWRCVPDLCVYRKAQVDFDTDITWVSERPLMAVEIFSPSQTLEDLTGKIGKLLEHGVGSVWLVIPGIRVITVFQKGTAPVSATAGKLVDPTTGLSVDLESIFA